MEHESRKFGGDDEAGAIRARILECVDDHPRGLAQYIADSENIVRRQVYAELRRMVAEGLLVADGRTGARRYQLTVRGVEARRRLLIERSYPRPSDAELLQRAPRTWQEAERRAWLQRKYGDRIQRND